MKDFLKYTLATVLGILIAGIIGTILIISTLSAIISMADKPADVKDKSLLLMRLEENIVERSDKNPLNEIGLPGFSAGRELGLDEILGAIKKAETDDRIKGIYLNPTIINAGMASVEEIRNALIDFKKSGKFVYAYGETLSQKAYYLVSVADKLVLNPKGMVELKGLSVQHSFFKKALEKIGVEMQIIRHGKFKAAVEPFMLEEMSRENELQTKTYIGSIWNQIVKGISESRGLSPEVLNNLADSIITFRKAELLAERGLVDTLMYKDEVINDLKEKASIQEKSDLRVVDVRSYAQVPGETDGKGLARDKLAVIYATGDIDLGGDGAKSIDSEELSRAIREARRDSSVKAIVLRVNSPGGSAYGSEVIWREVKLASQVKPVIASMGDVAASGGYYIAAQADTILADRTTITGSIGIFAMIPNAGELLNDKLGITQDVVKTNEHADILSLTRKLTGFEQALLQQYIEEGYKTFVDRVAEGRDLSFAQVDSVGEGRVWAAENAIANGLVDMYGGLNDAVKLAAEKAGLERYRIVRLPELKDPFEEWVKELSGNARARALQNELGDNYRIYRELKNLTTARGVLARLPFNLYVE